MGCQYGSPVASGGQTTTIATTTRPVVVVVIIVRQAGTWTLGCSAYTWTNVSWSNKIRRNYKGLKPLCSHSWGKLWTTRYKKTKPNQTQLPLLKSWEQKNRVSGAKAGSCACPLHSPPPEGEADQLSHPSSVTPGHTPTLTSYKEPARPPPPPLWSEKGNLLLFLTPSCCSRGPSKALPEFLVWPLLTGEGQEPCSVSDLVAPIVGTCPTFQGEELGTSRTTECSFPVGGKWPPERLVSASPHLFVFSRLQQFEVRLVMVQEIQPISAQSGPGPYRSLE
nr:uncharacterized protein LOC115857032 [Globicephala melas]